MSSPETVHKQINDALGYLVEVGLADDQNYAFLRELAVNRTEVTFPGGEHVSVALKDRSYKEIYDHLVQARAYNARMLDGALIQMMYLFGHGTLQRHRLAFFSAPHLDEFQNNPDIYLEDEVYADVVARNIVPFPLRFDYDVRDDVCRALVHPRSHLTLGQYENCRIPVSAPLTPVRFMDFILRNFYHTAFSKYAEGLPRSRVAFESSISCSEERVIHVRIPQEVGA